MPAPANSAPAIHNSPFTTHNSDPAPAIHNSPFTPHNSDPAPAIHNSPFTTHNSDPAPAIHNSPLTPHNSQKARFEFRVAVGEAIASRQRGVRVEAILEAARVQYPHQPTPSARRAREWAKCVKAGNPEALMDKRGTGNRRKIKGPLKAKIEGIFWQNKGRVQAQHIFEALCAEAACGDLLVLQAMLTGEIAPPISPSAISRHLKQMRQVHKETLLLVASPDRYKSHRQVAFGFADGAGIEAVNQLWEIDGSPLDLMLLDEQGVEKRFQLITVIDVKSRRAVAEIVESQNSLAVQRLLYRAIDRMGLPTTLAVDNGKDYLSHNVQGMLKLLGIAVKRLPAFSGEEKPFIERFIKTLQHDFCQRLPGFIGHSVAERAQIEAQIAKADRKAKRKTQLKNLLGVAEARSRLEGWVSGYNHRPHRGLQGSAPALVWASASLRRLPAEQLRFALAERFTRKVGKKGIALHSSWYQSPQLAAFIGQSIQIALDLDDVRHGSVFDEAGNFLCRVRDATQLPLSGEELREAKQIQKAQTKALRKAVKLASKAGVGLAEMQRQVAKAQASAAVDKNNVIELSHHPVLRSASQAAKKEAQKETLKQQAAGKAPSLRNTPVGGHPSKRPESAEAFIQRTIEAFHQNLTSQGISS